MINLNNISEKDKVKFFNLLKIIFKFLQNFCKDNRINQEILFGHIDLFLKYVEIDMG